MRPHLTLNPKELALAIFAVLCGGAVGTVIRDLLLKWQPSGHGTDWTMKIPWILLLINLVGVFLATRLLRGPLRHHDPNDLTRLLLITGLFGGFTSYSSLFVDLAAIWHVSIGGSIFVALLALLSGALAAWLGLGRRQAR
ncbi:MAG: CrcB family protein [Acidimicrobiales bacterium]|jgi:CrcB protein